MRESPRLFTFLNVACLPFAWSWASAGTTLPVPCAASACANSKFGASGFVSSGAATATQAGSKLTVNQTSSNVTLNWQSFNISANGTVQFVQPSASAVALNQINDVNPSQIFGSLNANGRVFLINQNGIVFGSGAQVNVGGLLASTLNIASAAASGGLIAPGSNGNPAFQAFSTGTTGGITVSQGATLQTASGGQILIFAPTITNEGSISTPGGQTMLAAGDTIYLATQSDPSLRGLLVEVGGTGGTVTNGRASNSAVKTPEQLVGQILASDGNVTLAGLAVNQLGRVSATTSINENGSIYLEADANGTISGSGSAGVTGYFGGTPGKPTGVTGGNLTLGANSDTEVTLDSSSATTVNSVAQLPSTISMTGANVQILSGSVTRATGGQINIAAAQSPGTSTSSSDGSRVYVAPGAELDVSGASIVLPVSDNVIPVELRGYELADSPLQQNGPLRSQTVYIDIRTGTPLANISGEIAAIGYNVVERNLNGGTISINSAGDAILAPGSTLDVAGGYIQYTGGYLNTTDLLTTTGQIVPIGSASPNVLYTGIANSATLSDPKWGTSTTYQALQPTYSPGYIEGKNGGSLDLSARQFVLDSSVDASVQSGLYQRNPDTTPLTGNNSYQPYNAVPQPASLTIGTPGQSSSDFGVDNVTVSPGLVLPTLLNANGTAFNPLSDDPATDPLPASYTASVLRPELLGAGGFGSVTIYTNGKFLLPASVALDFPAGGSFSATASLIDIEGQISAPGGSITALAEPTAEAALAEPFAIILGPKAALSADGEWVNDNPLLYPQGNSAPLFINGGSISVMALSDNSSNPGVELAPGSRIDVSGGAQLTAAGVLNAGTGGTISVAADIQNNTLQGGTPIIEMGAKLTGYGIYEGGTLAITDSAVCIAATNCSGGDPATLWVTPSQLASGGFSDYSLTADQGGITLAANTTVTLEQTNLVLPRNYASLSDLGSLIGTATLAVLPDQLRQPVSLSLNQVGETSTAQDGQGLYYFNVTNTMPSLTIGAGAQILADPLASLSLSSDIRIIEDGMLSAPGGTISLSLLANQPEATYNNTQAIWLGSQAVLNAAGVPRIFPNSLGQQTGEILPGGTVSLSTARGYLELLPGSLIDVSGSSGVLAETGVGGGAVRSEQVASAGGVIDLTASDGAELGGTFEAAAGAAGPGLPQPAGGTFSLTLDASGRKDDGAAGAGGAGVGTSFPGLAGITSSQIIVSATQPPIVIDPGLGIPNALAENAYVSASALAAAGFGIIDLKATPLSIFSDYAPLPGRIDFVGNVTLGAAESITLDAGAYSVSPGSTARVAAPYVEFGDSAVGLLNTVTAATAANAAGASTGGTLDVSGQFIELYGTSALQGISTASFTSSGDLRVRGLLSTASSTATTFEGALYTDGNLDLTAQQIYPTTLTQFVISADPNSLTAPTANAITIQASAGTTATPLSAGGALTLSAGTVTQDGVLRAPFGDITIDAASVTLGAGSLTSTSADGLIIPFGTTQGGIDWVYPLPNGNSVVYGTDGIAPPSQQVTLQGAMVKISKGATINVAGGGDLEAYEWVDGTGGTNDVLSNSSANGGRPGQFAILPSFNSAIAPYDPNISNGTTLQDGDSVYLSGMPGLPAGVYTLLPARYALLPGAFLVTQVSGYQDIQNGQVIPVLSGGNIISGYQTVAGTPFAGSYGESRTSGFEVVPASVVLQQAQYTTTSANQFFASQAQTAGVTAPRLPEDSGVLALVASNALSLGGTLDTAAPKGGLGAEVDISSADILVAPTAVAGQAGQIVLTSGSLDALGAQILLLGGLNNAGAINTTAQTVEIGSGAALTAPDVILTAQNQVTVDSGASITATGSAPPAQSFSLTGDGAFLNVSAGPQSTVTRSNPAGVTGILDLAAGSTVAAPGGSVYLEATDNVVTAGNLSLAGGDLAVQSSNILLGNAVPNTTGTLLSSAVLGSEGLRNLLLVSAAPIDINGGVTANASSITVDAPGLIDVGTNDADTLNASGSITLQNTQGTSVAAGTGAGTLKLDAPTIVLNGGSIALGGFDSVALNAGSALTGTASSGLSTGGALSVSASQITTGADVDLALSATGAVSLLAPAKSTALTATALGGSLTVTGSSIDVGTEIALPSGRVNLASTAGDISLTSGGSIDVAGLVQQYDGVSVASPGGSVSLASAGNITLASGSSIDVSAGKGGEGGSLSLSAPGTGGTGGNVVVAGTLSGSGAAGEGGSFSIDAQAFNFDAINSLLNVGGFTGGRTMRLRGPGNLEVLAAGSNGANAVTGSQVELEADQGSVLVDAGGVIDASGAQGGQVVLAAANGVIVNGTIDAHATLAGQSGGTVTLESGDTAGSSGTSQILVNAGSTINVSGAGPSADGAAGAGGSVLLSAPVATVQGWLDGAGGIALAGQIVGSTRTALVANQVYQNTSGVIASSDMSTYQANAASFMTGASSGPAAAITAAAASACNCAFVLEPGVEIDAAVSATNPTGALTLDTPWNLYTWRFGADNVPGVLTLRAQGGITFDASLSDGFAAISGTGAFTLPTKASDSWSYRIVAGADLTAADPQTVLAPSAANPGTVTISSGTNSTVTSSGYAPTMVRTGDGFIDVSASGDFVLGSQSSLLYTAGVAEPGATLSTGRSGRGAAASLAYPIDGGDIQLSVTGDVLGAPTNQFVNAWQWRLGSAVDDGITPTQATAWTVNFTDFQQGIGALAGGNVTIRAGGDIDNLSASIPTVGVPVTGAIPGVTAPEVLGGGNLTVTAGGSILGGSYDVGRGQLSLVAGADVGPTPAALNGGTPVASPIIGLGDASLAVTARGNVQVADILNPTLLAQGIYQTTAAPVYFSTYGADSSATLTAVGGSVTLDDESVAVGNAISSSFVNGGQALAAGGVMDTLPASVNLIALSGNVNVNRSLITSPSTTGNLQIFANQNIVVASSDVLVVPDADPSGLPSAAAPVAVNGLSIYSDIEGALSLSLPDQHAPVPVYAAADAAGTLQPVRIVALNGSIDFPLSTGTPDGIWSAKPVQIVAGQDVLGLNLVAQNLSSSDVTSIVAGGNITYPQERVASGQVLADASGIAVDGPGELELTAGGDVNLGTSSGIITRANLVNPVLPAQGASISVQAGVGAAAPAQYAAFISTYIDNSSQFDSSLIAYVQSIDNLTGLTAAQAKQVFNAMSPGLQRTYVEELFFELLQYYGSKEAASGNGDFSGAFAAISKLFPGANPAAGQTNPYQGNIELYFSQIYTEQGGNISLLAPGGEIDAGLALAPQSFGIDKQPDQLGIVAATTGNVSTFTYGDLQVDQSRLFAADGGAITVWSTDGNIDAGAGAKTSISAPEVNIAYDSNGQPTTSLRAAIAGSGIEALAATPGVSPGDVYLFAPRGVVNAGDAGIVAGNLTVAATAVIGANNITVSGTSVGVPLAPPALGANFAGASSTAGASANAAENFNASAATASNTPVADAAIGWLDVFVTGLGEENCKPDDMECLKHEGTQARPQ
jgi:filamentous hemagglutinin